MNHNAFYRYFLEYDRAVVWPRLIGNSVFLRELHFHTSRKDQPMKIRKKSNHAVVVEVVPACEYVTHGWRAVHSEVGTITFYSLADWEPVPQWETITPTILQDGQGLLIATSTLCDHTVRLPEGYRFVSGVDGLRIQRKVS